VSQDLGAATNLTSDLAALCINREPGSHRARRRLLYAVILLAITSPVLYIARGRITGHEVETIHPTVRRATVIPAKPILTASGYLVARRKGVVSAKIQGRLAALDLDEGNFVAAGQVIARLENSDLQAQIEVARAGVQQATADLAEKQRQLSLTQRLANNGVVSQDQLQAAVSRVRVAEAALSQSQANLSLAEANFENTIIRAPFAGVVVKKMAKLEPNQPAEVSVDATPDHTYRAVLRQVIPTADRTKATIAVKVRLLEKDKNLRPEMSAKITFLDRAGNSSRTVMPILTIPKTSLVQRNGAASVFVVDSFKKVHLVRVLTGGETQGEVIVEQGLGGTEALVLRPTDTLKDGDTVKTKS